MTCKKQFEVLNWASLFLTEHHREQMVAELLLQYHTGQSRSAFFANMQEPISADVFQQFKSDIEAHAKTGIPVQHLIGNTEFYGRMFRVNEHVLIPRPETEELVYHVIQQVKEMGSMEEPITIVDVGTGSGAIAITLALELPDANIFAIDISTEAIAVAKENAAMLGANVSFLTGDFLLPMIAKQRHANIIVSNPPYIAREEEDALADTVKNFEPALALFAADHGLAAYRTISSQIKDVLLPGGMVAFEIGYTQGATVKAMLLQTYPQCEAKVIQDINRKDRIVSAIFPT